MDERDAQAPVSEQPDSSASEPANATGDDGAPKRRSGRVWLRRLVAWGVTAAVIIFLLTRYSIGDIGDAVVRGNWPPLVGFIAGASIWTLLWMSAADWLTFTGALGRVRYIDVLRGKAGCSVLQAVSHAVGQGTYGLWIGRLTKSDVPTTLGALAYVIVTDLVALFIVVGGAAWLGDGLPYIDLFRWLAPLIVFGLVAFAFAGPMVLPRILPRVRLLRPWSRIGPSRFAFIVLGRLVALLGLMFATYAAATTFGLEIPALAFLAYLPFIFLAGALPINVLGFGAVQLVWVAAFEDWATGPQILAFQFLIQATAVAAFLLRGAPFLPSVLRDIERPSS